jgi:hypothetical protein
MKQAGKLQIKPDAIAAACGPAIEELSCATPRLQCHRWYFWKRD